MARRAVEGQVADEIHSSDIPEMMNSFLTFLATKGGTQMGINMKSRDFYLIEKRKRER